MPGYCASHPGGKEGRGRRRALVFREGQDWAESRGPLNKTRASPGATPTLGEGKFKVSLIRLADLEPLRFTNTPDFKPSRLLCQAMELLLSHLQTPSLASWTYWKAGSGKCRCLRQDLDHCNRASPSRLSEAFCISPLPAGGSQARVSLGYSETCVGYLMD